MEDLARRSLADARAAVASGGPQNGRSGGSEPGSGLVGLRERVAAAGGVVDAGPVNPKGWRLRVSLRPEAVA